MKQFLLLILILLSITSTIVTAEVTGIQNEEVTVEVDITSLNINISSVNIKVTAPDKTSTTSQAAYNPETGKWEISYPATSHTGTYKTTAIITDSDRNKHYSDETSFTIETNKVTITYRAGDFKASASISTDATGEIHISHTDEGFIVIDSKGNLVKNTKITTWNNVTLTTDSDGIIIEKDKFIDSMKETFNYTKPNMSEENATVISTTLNVYTDGTITQDGDVLEGVTIVKEGGKLIVKGMSGNASVGLNFVNATYDEYKKKNDKAYNKPQSEEIALKEIGVFNKNGTLIGTAILTSEISERTNVDKLIILDDGTITDSEGNVIKVKS